MTAGAISPSTEIPEAPVQPVESKGRGRRHARHRGSRSERSRAQSHGVQLDPSTTPLGDRANVEAAGRPQESDQGQSSSQPVGSAGLFSRAGEDQATAEAADRAAQQPDEGRSGSRTTSWADLFQPTIISQQQPVQLRQLVSLPGQDPLEQGTDWMDQLARDMSELVVQPLTDPLQDRGLANPFARVISEPAVQRQGAARPPPHSVFVQQNNQDWLDHLAHDMREFVVPQLQPAPPAPTAAVASRGRRGGLEPGYWGVESSNTNTTATSTSAILPTTPMSLNQLAEDASILLELFSQNPHDNNNMGNEDETMITSAAASIAAIQARCARRTRHTESREEINRDADCIICFAERADVVFLPCKHLVVCTVRTPPPLFANSIAARL